MRRALVIVVLVWMCLPVLATSASAQKDPFHPVIDPAAATDTTGATVSTSGASGETFTPSVGSEGLATTGPDVEPWLAIAYGLIVLGGGTLALARLQNPRSTRR